MASPNANTSVHILRGDCKTLGGHVCPGLLDAKAPEEQHEGRCWGLPRCCTSAWSARPSQRVRAPLPECATQERERAAGSPSQPGAVGAQRSPKGSSEWQRLRAQRCSSVPPYILERLRLSGSCRRDGTSGLLPAWGLTAGAHGEVRAGLPSTRPLRFRTPRLLRRHTCPSPLTSNQVTRRFLPFDEDSMEEYIRGV